MRSTSALTAFLLASSAAAFAPASKPLALHQKSASLTTSFLSDKAQEEAAAEAVFVPPPEATEEAADTDDDTFDKVEKFGKGAAKVSERNNQL